MLTTLAYIKAIKHYQFFTPTGEELGAFDATSPREAKIKLALSLGYSDFETVAFETVGREPGGSFYTFLKGDDAGRGHLVTAEEATDLRKAAVYNFNKMKDYFVTREGFGVRTHMIPREDTASIIVFAVESTDPIDEAGLINRFQFFADDGSNLGIYEADDYQQALTKLQEATNIVRFEGFFRQLDRASPRTITKLMHTPIPYLMPVAPYQQMIRLFEAANGIAGDIKNMG